MKEFAKRIIEKTIRYLSHIQNKFETDLNLGNNFHTLSPTDNAENVDSYIQTLDWALKNKKNIKNIAISGAYGSGKSSVINTFVKRNKNKDYKFLNISLATFKELKESPSIFQNRNNDILRLIELSVLQQLFYHEKDKKIPDSRFKKIKSQKTNFLFYYSVAFILLLISVLFLVTPDFISKFYLIHIPPKFTPLAHYAATSVTLIGLFFIIFKSSRALKGLAIKKLNISNAEIEIESRISKSILNNHIDEILYFFEVTDYNVVIIEDLDRFEQTEVFTKLREINLLINNSKKVEKEVVFIYAIKDDMFLDKDRTKFFDFMIPIIPVINSSNSNEKLLDIVNKNDYKISMDLIDDISLFIDDMRLLYNIMNEYYIYSENLDSKLDPEKLLSMVVYKNIYPYDFTQLSENKGNLFQTISNKSDYIKNRVSIINEQIEKKKKQIIEDEKIQFSDVRELRLIYINKLIEQIISTTNHGLKLFWINGQPCKFSDVAEDKNFEKVLSGSIEYQYERNSTNIRTTFHFIFEDIEKVVNPDLTYKEREDLLLSKIKIDNLKKQISELESGKIEIRKSKLSNLISDGQITINKESDKQSELINILLRNGYIDENYLDYISIFYEGSLSKADYQFLINVKIQRPSEFDYKLTKTERLIEKINLFDFEKEYILNFNLVETLQQRPENFQKKKRLFKQLSNESTSSIKFVDNFIEITTDIRVFIRNLCEHWQNIWTYIETESLYDIEKKNNYFRLIIKYAKVEDIKSIFSSHYGYLNQRADFLEIIDDDKKIKKIIEKLELKFNRINSDSPSLLIDYIYEGNYYALNKQMLEFVLKHYNKFDADKFLTSNFSSIMTSSLDSMINYIETDLEDYINSVYLKIESNKDEPIEYYLNLLNNDNLDEELKKEIITHVNTKIKDIKTVSDSILWNKIFELSKVSASWDNILAFFEREENKFSTHLTSFLNSISNAEVLSKVKMPTKVNGENIFSVLCRSIITHNEIVDESYNLITKSIPWWYSDIEFIDITEDRIIFLINNQVVNPTIESFNELKESHDGLNILLLEKYPEKYIEKIDELELDSYDLELILKSSILTTSEMNIFIKNSNEETINSSNKILKLLADYIIQNESFDIEISTIKSILLCKTISTDSRINLFNRKFLFADKKFIESFLESLGLEYQEITNYYKKAKLIDNPINRQLLGQLVTSRFISSFSETKKGLRINHKRK